MILASKTKVKKNRMVLIVLFIVAFITAGAMLNYWFGRTARQVARDQFNEEQLVVARGIRNWIERQIDVTQKEMILAAKKMEITTLGPEDLHAILQPCFERVVDLGVTRIEISDKNKRMTFGYAPYQSQVDVVVNETAPMEMEIAESGYLHPIAVSKPYDNEYGMYLKLGLPLVHPLYSHLCFQLNLTRFLTPLMKPVRSGKTGYAWLIDAQGRFLFHPQPEFIGQSAFEARHGRDPDFSYHQINTIQQDNMLKGMEGTGSYCSKWHRGITGKIEKLIAYCPVTVSTDPEQLWSVAVAAPVFEIEDVMRTIYLWQAVLQGLVVLVIIAAVGTLFWFEVRWSHRLEKIVAARTTALKRSEENYRSLVESAEDFIFTLDKDGKLTSVNSYTAAFFGSPPEALIGVGVADLFSPEVAARQIRIVRALFHHGKSIRDEFELKMDDSEMWISANFMPLIDDAGRMSAILCIARDITETKKLERHLINTEKLASLGTLAAGVAHEINNPLGVMLGFCDLLVRKKEPGSQEYEDLKIIERQGMHCKQVVENLLSFARVGQGTTTKTDLNACLQEIIKVVHHSLNMSAIDLRVELTENIPAVKGDDRQLQQVFLNLINNAAAAMPEGGVLTIKTYPVPGNKKMAAQIMDQGTGIPPEAIDYIFEPFFTTKPEGEGTGLGLFISYGIISKFGGSIVCESNFQETANKPRGTVFTVELPISGLQPVSS
jgi:PAS domain S-box-containing protein